MSRGLPRRVPSIRSAATTDASELARLISPQGFDLTTSGLLAVWEAWAAEGNFALVIEGEDCLLGAITLHRMVVLHRPKPVGRVTALAVDSAVQGQGFGRALVEAAEEELARAGCGLIEVTSHARRASAHGFYDHLGYERTGYRFAKAVPEAGLERPG